MTTLKKIDANLKRITTNGHKLNVLIHDTGMLILEHAKEHGDCTRALSLVKAMPASMRRTMLIQWIETFSPIRVRFNDDKVGMLKEKAKTYTPFDLKGAAATPFYEMAEATPEKAPLTYEQVLAMLPALAKRIQKRAEEGEIEENAIEKSLKLAKALGQFKDPANDTDEGVPEWDELDEKGNRPAPDAEAAARVAA